MEFNIESIFLPSVGVDLVFNINSLTPYSRSSIIYDTDFKNKTITIAQPLTPFTRKTDFKELHLSTIIKEKSRKLRVGIQCKHIEVIKKFPLANRNTVAAVKVFYRLPPKEINIRSAFRLPLSARYTIKGKIVHQNLEYYTPRDFSIRDISLSGLGIVIPKKKNKTVNPLTALELNEKLRIGIILVNLNHSKPIGTLPIQVQVRRVHQKYSDTHYLIGLKIVSIKPKNEDILNKFIHSAQIDELKRLSRRNL